jgi:rhodanese-related sulfurtransferase
MTRTVRVTNAGWRYTGRRAGLASERYDREEEDSGESTPLVLWTGDLDRERKSVRSLTECEQRTIETLGDHTTGHEPPVIRQLSAADLKALLESGTAIELVDVRTEGERAIARIEGSRLLDRAYHDALMRLERNTPIVFQCHHGIRSQLAAEYFRREGFRNLYNLEGGIDAWSVLVDPSVPRY